MATVIPLRAPASFVQGETVKWRWRDADYPPGTWTLSYSFVNADNAARSVTGTDNGDNTHLITLADTDSRNFGAGDWAWQAFVTDGSERFLVGTGRLEVVRDFTGADNFEPRSDWEVILDAITATIKGTATVQQSSMSVGGRSLSERSVEELLTLQHKARAEVESERRADAIMRGENPGGRILTRL